MKIKRLLSVVMGMSILALSVGVYSDVQSNIALQKPVAAIHMEMAEDEKISKGSYSVTGENGEVVDVIIPDEYDGKVSVGEIREIINDNNMKSGERLTINEVGIAEASSNGDVDEVYDLSQVSNDVMPQWKWYDLLLKINNSWYYGSEYAAKDVFIASAARGEIYSLTKKFSASLDYSCEAGGTYKGVKGTIGAKSSVSYSVEKKHQYSGPDRSSTYNSTEYRVKFYAKRCYVTQKVKGWPSDHTTTYNATFICPQRYLSYSIDRRV